MAGKFEIYQDEASEYHFHLKAGNGEIVLTGEGYQQKSSCENGIESVRTNAPLDERFEQKTSSRGEPYFVLKAANHQIIGQSQMYSSESARDGGIGAVQRAIEGAPVDTIVVADTNDSGPESVDDGRSPWLRRER